MVSKLVGWLVLLIFELLLTHNDYSLAETGVLLHKKDSDANWQWLTMYKLGTGSGWSRQSNPGRYVVCDIPSTLTNHTDSWLVSDFIQSEGVHEVVTSLTFTTRQCPNNYPYCVQYFNVFALFTDNEVSGGIPISFVEEGKLSFVTNVTAGVTWNASVIPQDNKVNVTFLLPNKGFYLALQDIGACISLREVSVTYKYCPLVTTNGVTYNQTFSPALRDSETNVTGKCLDNASVYSRSTLLVGKCLTNGEWKTDQDAICLCNPGFQIHLETCRGCPSGTYKSSHGNHVCSQCASNTYPSMSRDRCDCESGYYRTLDDPKNSSCTAPPSSPVDLRATVKEQNIAIVIWLPPISTGGRDDVRYDVICKQWISGVCDVPCNGISFWPANQSLSWTHVSITGVKSLVSYCITILAKNGVSDVAGVSYHSNASVILTIPEYNSNIGTPAETTNNSRKINMAIGVSVVCTFIFCLIVGCVLGAFFMHKQKNRVLFNNNERISDYKRHQNESPATNDTELQSVIQDSNVISFSSKIDIRQDTLETAPKVQVERIPTPGVPFAVNSWCHEMTEDSSSLQCPKPEDQAKLRKGSSVSVRSWFPQQDVQYGI